jgi:hypothetical protein
VEPYPPRHPRTLFYPFAAADGDYRHKDPEVGDIALLIILTCLDVHASTSCRRSPDPARHMTGLH